MLLSKPEDFLGKGSRGLTIISHSLSSVSACVRLDYEVFFVCLVTAPPPVSNGLKMF